MSFSGEPAGLVGPLALFRIAEGRGRRLPLDQIRPEDAYRYDQGLRALPPRAAKWSDAQARVTKQLVGNVMRLQENDRLRPYDLSAIPEPELLVVMYAEGSDESTKEFFRAAIPRYNDLQAKFPGMFEVFFFGVRHTRGEHVGLAESLFMPWIVADIGMEGRMTELRPFIPELPPGILIIGRHGVPITQVQAFSTNEVEKTFDQLAGLLVAMVPNNPSTWVKKVKFYTDVRTVEFAAGSCDPMLVGPPLMKAVLDSIGVTAFTVDITVDATGKATAATARPGDGLPEKYIKSVERAFLSVPFVPAISNGQPVEGSLTYTYSGVDVM